MAKQFSRLLRGVFSNTEHDIKRMPTEDMLKELTVQSEMNREKVMKCLALKLSERNIQVVRKLVDGALPEAVTPLPGIRKKLQEEAESFIIRIIHDVLIFCDEKIDDKDEDTRHPIPPPQKRHWAIQVLELLRDVLKLG